VAAIAAISAGAGAHISERSRSDRHKVCGEFISPEAFPLLESLGVWQEFLRLSPARIHRCILRFGSRVKQWTLPEPAYGLSRLELDRLLLGRAARAGATICRGEIFQASEMPAAARLIMASGRRPGPAGGDRLFGFKTHFAGPADDAIELYLGRSSYVGVNAVEGSLTNVCGIATEGVLRKYGFRIDEFLGTGPVAERLRPLSRRMPWLTVGPLTFSRARCTSGENVYPAGDALGFVDPFTGSGILNALWTGRMAGACAGRQVSSKTYMEDCGALLHRPFAVSALLRILLQWEYVSHLASLIPGNWIYNLTRPVLTNLREPSW